MLRDRLWVGALLILGVAAVLVFDERGGRRHASLAMLSVFLGIGAASEFRRLVAHLAELHAPTFALAVLVVLTTPWLAGVVGAGPLASVGTTAVALALTFLVLILRELAAYAGPGGAAARLAAGAFGVAYLGLLPSFLLHLRWLDVGGAYSTAWLLALVVAVPKGCDIGAYAAGRLFGRTPLVPKLSPKKTVEGLVGGLVAAVGVACGVQAVVPVLPGGYAEAAAFGLVLGLAGVAGDLAESMLKRDALVKDASATVPGFGGVLDVLDSILLAAPLGWLWLTLRAGGGSS